MAMLREIRGFFMHLIRLLNRILLRHYWAHYWPLMHRFISQVLLSCWRED